MPKVTYACIDCGKTKTAKMSYFKLLVNFDEVKNEYRCPSCGKKKLYKDNPILLENMRDRFVKRFSDPVEREKQSVMRKNYYETHPEAKEVAREKSVKQFSTIESREKHGKIIKNYYDTVPNANEKTSVATKLAMGDPRVKNNVSIAQKKRFENPLEIERLRDIASGIHPSKETLEKRSVSIIESKLGIGTSMEGGFCIQNVRYSDPPKYCEKFNLFFKKRVRAFWDYKCFNCGKPESENIDSRGRHWNLMCHHIHDNKMMCCDGSPEDIVPLCIACHARTKGKKTNRAKWEKIFTGKLYKDNPIGKCFYTTEEMIEIEKAKKE